MSLHNALRNVTKRSATTHSCVYTQQILNKRNNLLEESESFSDWSDIIIQSNRCMRYKNHGRCEHKKWTNKIQ